MVLTVKMPTGRNRNPWQPWKNDPLEMLAEQEKGEAIKRFSVAMMEERYCSGCGTRHLMPVKQVTGE